MKTNSGSLSCRSLIGTTCWEIMWSYAAPYSGAKMIDSLSAVRLSSMGHINSTNMLRTCDKVQPLFVEVVADLISIRHVETPDM